MVAASDKSILNAYELKDRKISFMRLLTGKPNQKLYRKGHTIGGSQQY